MLIAVGPEGGFTEQEIEQAEEAGFAFRVAGCTHITNGDCRNGRSTCLLYETGEMGG